MHLDLFLVLVAKGQPFIDPVKYNLGQKIDNVAKYTALHEQYLTKQFKMNNLKKKKHPVCDKDDNLFPVIIFTSAHNQTKQPRR